MIRYKLKVLEITCCINEEMSRSNYAYGLFLTGSIVDGIASTEIRYGAMHLFVH